MKNQMMPHIYKQYLDFLKYSLSTDAEIPASVERIGWDNLYQFAQEYRLIGVFFCGIMRLPKGSVPISSLTRWRASAEEIIQQNYKVTLAVDKITTFFAQNGFRSVVLKGQGNALMYPYKWMRTSGDIDICVVPTQKKREENNELEDDDIIINFCREKLDGGKLCYHHIDVKSLDGVEVEVHYRPAFRQNLFHNRQLQNWFIRNLDLQCSNVQHVIVNGKRCEFAMPIASFNVVYQLCHMSSHLLQEGIGLRQLVDYYMLLQSSTSELEGFLEVIRMNLKSFGLYKFAGAVMWVLHETLGLSEEQMVVPMNARFGKVLLDEILIGGNFGKFDKRIPKWKRTTAIGRNIQRIERDLRLCWYYPSEALSEPIFRLWHLFWRRCN